LFASTAHAADTLTFISMRVSRCNVQFLHSCTVLGSGDYYSSIFHITSVSKHIIVAWNLCELVRSSLGSFQRWRLHPNRNETSAGSLDPFRKKYKRQKRHFQAQLASTNVYRRCIIGCCVITREKYKMAENVP